jgi:hypothetical protein
VVDLCRDGALRHGGGGFPDGSSVDGYELFEETETVRSRDFKNVRPQRIVLRETEAGATAEDASPEILSESRERPASRGGVAVRAIP